MKLQSVLALDTTAFFDYIKSIPYGYRDRAGKLHLEGEADFHDHEYRFSTPEEVVDQNCGWCWDVANLISCYCENHGIEHITLFLEYNTPELHQTHTQVFLRWNRMWCPAPDNSAVYSLGDGGRGVYEACRDNYAETFRSYLKSVLKEHYEESSLLVKPVTVPIPGGISDEEYLSLARKC